MTKHVAFVLPGEHHAHRGIGFYTRELLSSISQLAPAHDIVITALSGNPDTEYDLVHYAHFDLFRHTLPLFSRQQTVVSVLDVIPLESRSHYPPGVKGALNLYLQKLALKKAQKIITISQYSKNSISRYLDVNPADIEVTPLAPSPPIFKPITNPKILEVARRKYALPKEFVLYVGDVNWSKNLLNLTIATQKLHLQLVVVGKMAKEIMDTATSHITTHPELVTAQEWAARFRGDNHVQTLGFVPDSDLVKIYNLATVYCQPSFLEGFGMPLLQSLSTGTPSISSNTSSLPEVGGNAVRYFDPYDTNSIVQTLKEVFYDPKIRRKLKLAGLKRAKLFSWNSTAARTLEVYLKLLKK